MTEPINKQFLFLFRISLENIIFCYFSVAHVFLLFFLGKSKKTKKKKKEHDTSKEEENKVEKRGETDHGEAYCISSVDEDCSKGLKSMYSYCVICFSSSNSKNMW